MKYTTTYYFTSEDIDSVISGVKSNFKLDISESIAIKIIRNNLKIFGSAWLWDKQIEILEMKDYIK